MIIDRDAEMFQKIVADIAIDFRADRIPNVSKIDNPNINVIELCLSDGERIDLGQRYRNFSAGALAFFRADEF